MATMFNGVVCKRAWMNRVICGAWVLGETHYRDAPSWAARLGLWLSLPEDKSANSWRWLSLRFTRTGPVYSVRWTLPKWGK